MRIKNSNNSASSTIQLAYEEQHVPVMNTVPEQAHLVLRLKNENISNIPNNEFYGNILDSPPQAFTTFSIEGEEANLNLVEWTERTQLENIEFSNRVLAQLNPLIHDTNEFSLLPDNARILDWDDRARRLIARSIYNSIGQTENGVESVFSQLPNLTEYGRVLTGHFNRVGMTEDLVRHISTAAAPLPQHMVGVQGNPVFDKSLFVFLQETAHFSFDLVNASIHYFSFTSEVAVVAFALFFSPLFLSLSDFTLRKMLSNRITVSGFFNRIRNTFIIFRGVRNFQVNSLLRFNLKMRITDLQNNIREGMLNFSCVGSEIHSKFFSLLNKYYVSIIFGGGIFFFRKELIILAKRIIEKIRNKKITISRKPKPFIGLIVKFLVNWWYK
jgi:hypothetical protein